MDNIALHCKISFGFVVVQFFVCLKACHVSKLALTIFLLFYCYRLALEMAEGVKSRQRLRAYEFQIGELVDVDGAYFDDPRQPVESRYSASLTNGRVEGRVAQQTGESYKIDFEDGGSSYVPKDKVHLKPYNRQGNNVVTTSTHSDVTDSDNDSDNDKDNDYQPVDDAESSNSDSEEIPSTDAPSLDTEEIPATARPATAIELKEGEEVYLCHLGKDIFKATYQDRDGEVHGKKLGNDHGRFFIMNTLKDAGKWKDFDAGDHSSGAVIMWKLRNLRRMIRTPFSELGTEATFATPLPFRKRKRNEANWNNNQKKIAVNSGRKITFKNRKREEKKFGRERNVGARCGDTCRKACNTISDDDRKIIHESFWNLASWNLQRGFLADHVKHLPKQRERKRKDENGALNLKPRCRQMTRQYQLTSNRERKTVCQKFFLSTLSIDERRIRQLLDTLSATGTVELDKRGKHNNHFTKAEEEAAVVAHISKFKTVDSHYVRKTAKAQYLPQQLTVKEMHRMYVEEHDGNGKVEDYKFYHRIFTERFNLKFQKNKKDQCDKCEGFKNTPDDKKTPEMIAEHDMHIDEKASARDLKAEMKLQGKDDGVVSSAFDLEKVLLAPHGQTSSFYYSKRLKIHNFTITDITSMETHCYVWHEGEAAKGSSEVATCLQQFLQQTQETNVNLFSDRCGGQNSNRMVIIAIHDVFYRSQLEELTMNFLVTGHSQNENDTAHSNIEQAVRKRTLYTPDQWKTAIQFVPTRKSCCQHIKDRTCDRFQVHRILSRIPSYSDR